ncbi:malto-oligosyltrehalose trehalohydrolase [Gemmatirosa kalamazoonensis]|uniref:Malto-oligosyltrehalose trehalohydrolase n=1 Tax=Gemmatirosa kalamazoonensis TaxID=861299 RepID=W0RGC4_9BACT|nr:malto-oligosyltrehalose trehalohydrolase [Gemmatirosa kalamazoonensis]
MWAPHARDVALRLYDTRGDALRDVPLEPLDRGEFAIDVPGVRAGADYALVLDGGDALPDPASRWQPRGVHGPSRVVDPAAFRWTDAAWQGLARPADYVIYELHVGTFTDAGTFDAAIAHLAELRALGVTAIEIMPVAEFPGDRNWGYDGVHLYAPSRAYGGPDALRRLVDAAHAHGIAVVLDVVYNHVGPEGNYLERFGPYFTDRYQTPWGRAVNYDGPGADGVRRHVIENACYWVEEFHVDALRLDAIHGIYDFGARHVLAELTDGVHALAESLGRRVHLIAESDLSDPRVVRPTSEHGLGFDAQWADDLHHAVHVALTGESAGYYADFARYGSSHADNAETVETTIDECRGRAVAALIAALRAPFVYDGRYAPSRDRVFGASAEGIPRERFVVCSQNHDQIGNRAHGDRLATLVGLAQQKLAAAIVLLSGYVPMLFMGEEYGETRPFQYFVSHSDADLVHAVREGRRREFAEFAWSGEVPDPVDEATFRRSTLDRSVRRRAPHAQLQALYRDLLAIRAREPALRPDGARVRVDGDADRGWVRVTFGDACCAVFNLGAEPRVVPLPEIRGAWRGILSTDDVAYGGAGATCVREGPRGDAVRLAPFTAELFAHDDA